MSWFKKLFLVPVCIISIIFTGSSAYAKTVTLCDGFTSETISPELRDFMDGKSFKMYSCDVIENDWVRFEDLRYLKVKHWGYDDKVHDGELVVHESIAQEVLEIFEELYDRKFPIYQMKLIDNYDSDDERSMSANNTSCLRTTDEDFHLRRPWHALGMAIDVNPMNNPCIFPEAAESEPKFVPHNAEKYLDRSLCEKGMIKSQNICYNAFTKRGWEWGGSWTDPVDLHHFQKYTWTTDFPRKYKKNISNNFINLLFNAN